VTRRARLLVLLPVLALGLAGCSGWLGDKEPPPLPGKRIPVMLLSDDVKADPRLDNLTVALPEPVANDAWPQTGGNAAHDMGHLAAGDTLKEAWRADIGAGTSGGDRLIAGPVVGGGRVYTVDAEGTVSAYATGDGTRLWRLEPEDVEHGDRLDGGGLAYDDGWLYLTLTHGDVVGINADTGTQVWRQNVQSPIRTGASVAGGKVLVVTADNQLFAMDAHSGELLWRHQGIFEQTGILGSATPAISGDAVIVTYSSGEVFGLRLDDGRPVWTEQVLRPRRTLAMGSITDITAEPVIDNDRVIVAGTGGETVAFDLQRGVRDWSVDVTSRQMPWVAGEYIFEITDRNEVVAMLRQGGRIRWVSPLPRNVDPEDTSSDAVQWVGPVLAGDRLLFASSDGKVASVSPYTGEILGMTELAGGVSLPPVVAERTVYFLTDDGDLLAYR
jgi:outer membrane protein assembly factor BamB